MLKLSSIKQYLFIASQSHSEKGSDELPGKSEGTISCVQAHSTAGGTDQLEVTGNEGPCLASCQSRTALRALRYLQHGYRNIKFFLHTKSPHVGSL